VVVVSVVEAVVAGANASSRVVRGELDGDADSCRLAGALIAGALIAGALLAGALTAGALLAGALTAGALLAGAGGETVAEGVVPGRGGAVATVLGLGSKAVIVLGLGRMAAIVPALWDTAAITDLPSPSWPAICTTTPLALAIDPQTSAAEAAASGRDWCIKPPPNPTAFPGRPRSRLPLLVAPAAERFNGSLAREDGRKRPFAPRSNRRRRDRDREQAAEDRTTVEAPARRSSGSVALDYMLGAYGTLGAYGDCGSTFLGASGLRGSNPRLSADDGALRNSGVQ
jgi:hypothetical protein